MGETVPESGKDEESAKNSSFLELLPVVRQQIIDGFTPKATDVFRREFDFFDKVIEQVEVEYVPEKAEFDGHLNEEFRKVFEKFNFKEIVGSKENDKKDKTTANSTSKKVDSDSEEEE
ncbi:Phosphatidylinositol 4-kinase alpha 1 [Camellia lanceoleosa]|uniref:Phosphatidylinositol 4-kinase alpha 1 n=1 Tax=Camellia lanceoleosa TaxID=1840588 RepID=A0ACC0FD74_9ERIC|nr:Phosphatidylinositol 4-kinase alpha 1 [Camellia lanceoleosa]